MRIEGHITFPLISLRSFENGCYFQESTSLYVWFTSWIFQFCSSAQLLIQWYQVLSCYFLISICVSRDKQSLRPVKIVKSQRMITNYMFALVNSTLTSIVACLRNSYLALLVNQLFTVKSLGFKRNIIIHTFRYKYLSALFIQKS